MPSILLPGGGRRMRMFLAAHLLLWLVAGFLSQSVGGERLTVEPRESWSDVFGRQELSLGFRVTGAEDRKLRIGWTASIEKRVVARNELMVDGVRNQPVDFSIRVQLPDAEPRTIIGAAIAITIDGRNMVEKPLWIFPRDPFADQRKTLGALPITLFDPERNTARLLEELEIPFIDLSNADELDGRVGGLVVIGEGTSFRDYRGLSQRLVELASRGNRVLCLALSGGTIDLSELADAGSSELNAFSLRKADRIAEFEKRLDFRAWHNGKVTASGITLKGERGRIVAEISKGPGGWPWFEADFQTGGRLVFCGFGVIENWESGPAPRFLLRHAFEWAAMKKP